jgi:glycerophosphoryl diester phosphodiesterase
MRILYVLASLLLVAPKMHIISIKDPKDIKAFFHYTPDRIPFVSSHRGGPAKGFPENCIATFENTLQKTWSILEVDPRYTKDSIKPFWYWTRKIFQ